jgi:hypothetical protein
MIVDLNKLDFRQAKDLITWCVANNIDKKQASNLLFAWYEKPLGDGTLFGEKIMWQLDVPGEHLTYWMLRWK